MKEETAIVEAPVEDTVEEMPEKETVKAESPVEEVLTETPAEETPTSEDIVSAEDNKKKED